MFCIPRLPSSFALLRVSARIDLDIIFYLPQLLTPKIYFLMEVWEHRRPKLQKFNKNQSMSCQFKKRKYENFKVDTNKFKCFDRSISGFWNQEGKHGSTGKHKNYKKTYCLTFGFLASSSSISLQNTKYPPSEGSAARFSWMLDSCSPVFVGLVLGGSRRSSQRFGHSNFQFVIVSNPKIQS